MPLCEFMYSPPSYRQAVISSHSFPLSRSGQALSSLFRVYILYISFVFAVALSSFISSFCYVRFIYAVMSARVQWNTIVYISPFFNSLTVYEID